MFWCDIVHWQNQTQTQMSDKFSYFTYVIYCNTLLMQQVWLFLLCSNQFQSSWQNVLDVKQINSLIKHIMFSCVSSTETMSNHDKMQCHDVRSSKTWHHVLIPPSHRFVIQKQATHVHMHICGVPNRKSTHSSESICFNSPKTKQSWFPESKCFNIKKQQLS